VSSPSSVKVSRAPGLAIAAVVTLAACLLLGYLGALGWPFDLFANFRVQYFVLFIAFALMLFVLDRTLIAVLSLVGAVIAAIPLVAYMTFPGRAAEANPASFRLVTLNVWFRNESVPSIARHLEGLNADAIVLQELTADRLPVLTASLPSYPHVAVEPGTHGVVVFSKWPLVESRSVPLSSEVSGRFVTLDWQGTRVNLLGVHVHWPLGPGSASLRLQELQTIASFAARFREPLLVAGDLNLTPWSPHFRQLLRDSGMLDAAVGQGLMPSWPSQFRWVGIRIDHCLATPQWRSVNVRAGPHVGSDHRAVVADLQLLPT
jgi:endonuclease/exonuclease/phosphatase (EEP) superfamily protein YafD